MILGHSIIFLRSFCSKEFILNSFELRFIFLDLLTFKVLKIELIGEKIVTEAGMKAFEKAGFKGVVNIKDGKIRVLTMEMLVAVPKQGAFK